MDETGLAASGRNILHQVAPNSGSAAGKLHEPGGNTLNNSNQEFFKTKNMATNGTPISWPDSEAGKRVQARFEEDRTLNAIEHLLARIDTLEKAVEHLSGLMEQAPGMVAMAADTVDEVARKAGERGVNVEEHLQVALQLAEKLTAPAMLEKLNFALDAMDQLPGMVSMAADVLDDAVRKAEIRGVNVEERLDVALQLAERLTHPSMIEKLNLVFDAADAAPGMVVMAADVVDETARKLEARGIDLEERLDVALQMAEKLTQPSMLDKLNLALEAADQIPAMIVMAADTVDEAVRKADARGVNIEERLTKIIGITEKLTDPELLSNVDKLLDLNAKLPGLIAMSIDIVDEGLQQAADNGFDPKSLFEIAGRANSALTSARMEPAQKLGVFGLLRALNDEDRQRGLAFFMNFLKYFGRTYSKDV